MPQNVVNLSDIQGTILILQYNNQYDIKDNECYQITSEPLLWQICGLHCGGPWDVWGSTCF